MKRDNEIQLLNPQNDDSEQLLAQYQICVEMADKVSDRRASANNFFVVVNSALIALISLEKVSCSQKLQTVICSLGILVSLFWWVSVLNYKKLNSAKFKIIHELESKLPVNLYKYEWFILKPRKSKRKYWPLSHIESYIHWLFIVAFVILIKFI